MSITTFRPVLIGVVGCVGALILAACGSDTAPSAPSPTAIHAVKPATPTAVPPPATAVPEPKPKATPEPKPTATPEPKPTATPEPEELFNEYGFSITLDKGAYPSSIPGSSAAKGMTRWEYGGANIIISWVPSNGVTYEGLISGMFGMLQENQPGLSLETVSESGLRVGLETGRVLGIRSLDGSDSVVGGGLIGAWDCLDTDTSFSLAVTGEDAPVVQLRFNRVMDNFECAQLSTLETPGK